jgi:hypothetical protein
MDLQKLANGMSKEMRASLAEMLAQAVLEDPDYPEGLKMPVRIINASRAFSDKLHNATHEVIMPIGLDSTDEEIAKAAEFMEYVKLMHAGFDNFLAQYK